MSAYFLGLSLLFAFTSGHATSQWWNRYKGEWLFGKFALLFAICAILLAVLMITGRLP